MKYSEAIKLIKRLSKEYSINNDDEPIFELIYKSKPIAWVDKREQFNFGSVNISAYGFDKLPYSHKLWMILAELAMTKLSNIPKFRQSLKIIIELPSFIILLIPLSQLIKSNL